jgi:hypothetical protein
MEELRDFTERDFLRALDRLPAVRGDELDRLMFAAVSLAADAMAGDEGISTGAVQGAGAFISGVLLAIALNDGEASDVDRIWLSDGAAEISARGRHAVIAERCDLQAVAMVEGAYADELAAQVHGLTEEESSRLRDVLVRLFESGLALGLLREGG